MAKKPKLPKGVDLERSLKLTPRGEGSMCYALVWSPDGSQLAAGFYDGAIHLWDAGTWAKPRRIAAHKAALNSLSWSPDGRRLASGSDDKMGCIWDIKTLQRLHSYRGRGVVWSAAWSPNGRVLAWGDNSINVNLRETSGADEKVRLEGHSLDVNTVAWSGRLAASVGIH